MLKHLMPSCSSRVTTQEGFQNDAQSIRPNGPQNGFQIDATPVNRPNGFPDRPFYFPTQTEFTWLPQHRNQGSPLDRQRQHLADRARDMAQGLSRSSPRGDRDNEKREMRKIAR